MTSEHLNKIIDKLSELNTKELRQIINGLELELLSRSIKNNNKEAK